MYSISKTFSMQKIGFWGNLDHLGKNLLSNALNRDNLPRKQNKYCVYDSRCLNLRFEKVSNHKKR